MPKINIYSSVWEKQAKNMIFGQKRENFGKKMPKKLKISPQKDQKVSLYDKNQEHLQKRLGEIGQKHEFGLKRQKFGKKWPKRQI